MHAEEGALARRTRPPPQNGSGAYNLKPEPATVGRSAVRRQPRMWARVFHWPRRLTTLALSVVTMPETRGKLARTLMAQPLYPCPVALLWLFAHGMACREPAASVGERSTSAPDREGQPAPFALTPRPAPPGVDLSARQPLAESLAPGPSEPRILAPSPAFQHLAVTRERLAVLLGEELVVRQLGDFRTVARFQVPGARNVVATPQGDFLVAGSQHVYRLSGLDRRAEQLPPVPRLGPTTLLPGSDSSDHFWLAYEGIPRLPEFDLQETIIGPYVSVLSWISLPSFDDRALASFGDGSFVYTTAGGLRRVRQDGTAGSLGLPALAGDVWRLLPAARDGELWAATPHHAYLLRTDPAAEVRQRIELPPRPVALASRGEELGVLAVDSVESSSLRLRVELYQRGSESRRVLRFDEPAPAPAAGDRLAGFAPELALAPARNWAIVMAFGLSVYDTASGALLFPPGAPSRAQNLAPGPR